MITEEGVQMMGEESGRNQLQGEELTVKVTRVNTHTQPLF